MLTAILNAPAPRQSLLAIVAGRNPPQGTAWMIAAAMLVLLPASLALLLVDPRQLNGISVWAKPIKFQLSLAVHFATLAWLVQLVTPAAAGRVALRLGCVIAGGAALFEILYITLQAARGRASHFNAETPLELALYQVMGVGAVLIVANAIQAGWVIRRHSRPEIGAGFREGASLGLILGGIATLLTAGVLGSGEIAGPGHWVGGIRSDVGGLPLLGWSQSGGDLRVPHFFATHLTQILPLLGLLADRIGRGRLALVRIGGVLGLAIVLATFLQAIAGVPFLTL
jgi:hypothetical protein